MKLKHKIGASALILSPVAAFADVDPAVLAGIANVQDQASAMASAGIPAIVALGIVGIGVSLVVFLLRRASTAVR